MAQTVTERKTRVIATLGASELNELVRLVVVQFMMPTNRVSNGIPLKRKSEAKPFPKVSGEEVLTSTPDLNIFQMLRDVGRNYELVDAWQQPHATNWKMTVVRFVYCRNEYVKRDELFPDFVARRDALTAILINLVSENLWTTQGYLNLYFETNGVPSGHNVLMFGCVARKPNVEVYRDGRYLDTNRGIGPKVWLSTLAGQLMVTDGEVQLQAKPQPPEPQYEFGPSTIEDDNFDEESELTAEEYYTEEEL